MTKPPGTFANKVTKLFDEKGTLTVQELYAHFSNDKDIELSSTTLRHRIRSAVWGMKKTGKIIAMGDGKYKKI